MNAREARQRLVGRKIKRVLLRPFGNGMGGKATDPTIELDDGTRIYFIVQETETGEYGIQLCVTDKADDAQSVYGAGDAGHR